MIISQSYLRFAYSIEQYLIFLMKQYFFFIPTLIFDQNRINFIKKDKDGEQLKK